MGNLNFKDKFKVFLKKNYYYVIMSVCVIAIGVMITVAVVQGNRKIVLPEDPSSETNLPGDGEEEGPPVSGKKPMIFTAPIQSSTGMGLIYDDEDLQYSTTMKQWQAHFATDFLAPVGTDVVSAFDGVVESITTNEIMGTIVVILHDDDVRTIYKCLADNLNVIARQKVTAGQKIGVVGDKGYLEQAEGPHLHFEVTVNGKNVNPNLYFSEEEK